MSKVGLVLFFVLVSIIKIDAQTTLGLYLPVHSNDHIQFDLSDYTDDKENKFDYDFLSVFVANEKNEYISTFAIQGNYSIVGNNLIFKPYFPFDSGILYVVKLKNVYDDDSSYVSFKIGEKEKTKRAQVLNIFPTSNLLPENLFRFYIYFQTPMKQEEALKHIKLIDEEGKIDNHAFMKFKEELWSIDGKRLTLLFDPGRIKRGVSTNINQGPSLRKGRQYHLSISKKWQDVYGQHLINETKKEITVVAAYRRKMNLNQWVLNEPIFDSFDNLIIQFDRILDHALLQSMMQIRDYDGNLVRGYWEILDTEKQVQFVPENRWKKGNYKIKFDTRIEDISGNNLQNLLDHPTIDKDDNKKFEFINLNIS